MVKSLFVLCSILAAQAAKADDYVTLHTCSYDFAVGSSSVNVERVRSCLESVDASQVKKITVIGSADSTGSEEFNQQLSEQRAMAADKSIRSMFPGATIETQSVGISDLGRVAQMNLMGAAMNTLADSGTTLGPYNNELNTTLQGGSMTTEQPATTADTSMQTAAIGSPSLGSNQAVKSPARDTTTDLRVAVRGANDRYWIRDQREYGGIGAEVSFVPKMIPGLRSEVGVVGTAYTSSQEQEKEFDLYSAHLIAGLGVISEGGFAAGVRGLAGAAFDYDDNWDPTDHVDGGGEGRIGYEKNSLSIYAGAGRTQNFTRLGVDFGWTF